MEEEKKKRKKEQNRKKANMLEDFSYVSISLLYFWRGASFQIVKLHYSFKVEWKNQQKKMWKKYGTRTRGEKNLAAVAAAL